ncbi:DYW domain [Dillenia turbinata]|uniref:DYW domain n=1 Tax=Dillenia turbinata TaxID=194707 RepID=A0AAN8YVG1_9MAGN
MVITTMSQAMQLHAQILKSDANPKPNNIETKNRDLTKIFTFAALSGNLIYAHSILHSLSAPNSYFYDNMIRAYTNSSNPLPSLSLSSSKCTLKMTHSVQNLTSLHIRCVCNVFSKMSEKDVVSWTSTIDGFLNNDKPIEALRLFEEMLGNGVEPNDATFVSVRRASADTGALSLVIHGHCKDAIKNGGWVHEALSYFWRMKSKYGIRPTIYHYGCIVNLYGRAGQLDKAEAFVNKMIIKPDLVLWRNLIWACKIHEDTDQAERLMKHVGLLDIEASDCGSYVHPGNVMLWLESGMIGQSHIDAEKIYEKLDEIEEQLRGFCYDPKVSEVLLEIDDDEKAFQLCHHSENLAVALGLIETSPGTHIHTVKNLHSCEDCHFVMPINTRRLPCSCACSSLLKPDAESNNYVELQRVAIDYHFTFLLRVDDLWTASLKAMAYLKCYSDLALA